jgi:hypothetical protein
VWKIADAPGDWNTLAQAAAVSGTGAGISDADSAPVLTVSKQAWPYNLFSEGAEVHPGRK